MERATGWNTTRALILRLIADNKKPISLKDLQKKAKIPRTTLYHHLTQLKKRDLILEMKDKEATGKFIKGHPVYLSLNRNNPNSERWLKLMGELLSFIEVEK
jgi:DNA-binding transcriptional ArsR family regulator